VSLHKGTNTMQSLHSDILLFSGGFQSLQNNRRNLFDGIQIICGIV
jgi:hypothetical protein